mgnify:CR=1 FL=1
MFNDTIKIAMSQMGKMLGKDNAYIYNNFDIVNRFKVLTQRVEFMVISSERGHGLVIINTETYKNWENTPVLDIPDSLKMNKFYTPDHTLVMVNDVVTVEQIDELLKRNKCTYIGTTYKGKHDSNEYMGMAPIREVKMSFYVTPGIFK